MLKQESLKSGDLEDEGLGDLGFLDSEDDDEFSIFLSDDEEDEVEEEDELEEEVFKRYENQGFEIPPEFWQIQKLVKVNLFCRFQVIAYQQYCNKTCLSKWYNCN